MSSSNGQGGNGFGCFLVIVISAIVLMECMSSRPAEISETGQAVIAAERAAAGMQCAEKIGEARRANIITDLAERRIVDGGVAEAGMIVDEALWSDLLPSEQAELMEALACPRGPGGALVTVRRSSDKRVILERNLP